MHAITIEADDDRTLVWTEIPTPSPGPGEVAIRAHATAVNRADLLQRRGLYPPPPGASEILGLEVAGIVAQVGDGVDARLLGQSVMCLLAGGGYAETVIAPADHLMMIPDSLTMVEAAAVPEVFLTAFVNLMIEAELQEGETVLIHAAASGVGTAAVQLAKAHGCEVFATASASKLATLREIGADHVIDRRGESFDEVVARETERRGVDVILDPVGASYLESNVASLAHRGRLVLIGLLGGNRGAVELGTVLRRRLRVIGSVLRSRTNEEKANITRRFCEEALPLIASRSLRPIIHDVLPIVRANEAHELLRSNETTGKVVLTIAADA